MATRDPQHRPPPVERGPLEQDRRKAEQAEARQWFSMLHLGFEFIVAILLFGTIGWFLDRRWDTVPWLMIAGGVIGFAVGLWLMIRAALKMFHD